MKHNIIFDYDIINFGKYKGKTFKYVINNDLSYCCWIYQQNIQTDSCFNDFKNYLLLSKSFKFLKKCHLTFGIYKNMSFYKLFKYHQTYIFWLIKVCETSNYSIILLKNFLDLKKYYIKNNYEKFNNYFYYSNNKKEIKRQNLYYFTSFKKCTTCKGILPDDKCIFCIKLKQCYLKLLNNIDISNDMINNIIKFLV